jgi:hypothetical protein
MAVVTGKVPEGEWLGVAFFRGDMGVIADDLVMAATMGAFVHCEVVRGRGRQVHRVYTSFQEGGGFLPSSSRPSPPTWAMFAIPVANPAGVHAAILSLLALNLPYNSRDLWQCCFKAMLPWETELDCDRPETWRQSGVFCSQVALLLLRRFARSGDIVLPADTRALVEATHSRGCSPNTLFGLLSRACPRVF